MREPAAANLFPVNAIPAATLTALKAACLPSLFAWARCQVRVGLDHRLEAQLPGFLALQWGYFAVAGLQVYGSWLAEAINDPKVDTTGLPVWLSGSARYYNLINLALFGALFVASVLSLEGPNTTYKYARCHTHTPPRARSSRPHASTPSDSLLQPPNTTRASPVRSSRAPSGRCRRYQVQRLCFTCCSLLLIFGQMAGTPGVTYQGLIWYFVPSSIVATNDIMAYFTGVACGR